MDIWAWVDRLTDELEEAGQERAAALFYTLAGHISEYEIAQAEALLPEALAMAKSMENPWVEVFFRHWQMRLRLGALGEGETALPDVVALLELAHREECEGCPQVMCTTQDIADCYANMDGPGWADERRAVAAEGLARIDPSWNCFGCLFTEYIEAFRDQGRCAEALEACEEYFARQTAAGQELDVHDLSLKADILRHLGRAREALDIMEEVLRRPDLQEDVRYRLTARITLAGILTALDRPGEAWEALPAWSEIPPGSYREWLQAAGEAALRLPEKNTWELGSLFQKALEHFSGVGAHRHCLDMGRLAVELALARGAYSTPRRALRLMRRHLSGLRAPLGADRMLEELEGRVACQTPPGLPVPADDLARHIRESDHKNAEEGLDWLYAARDSRPDDLEMLLLTCSALAAMEAGEEARELLRERVRRCPDDCEDALDALIRHTPLDRSVELEDMADFLEAHTPALAHWTRLYAAYRTADRDGVHEQAEAFLALRPDSLGARIIRANTEMDAGNFAEAMRLRQEIVDLAAGREDEDLNGYRWDLLTAATCARDWKLVRDICIAMEFQVEPGDAPIDDPGQYVRIRYLEDGRWKTAFAQRNGPVTARILSCCWPGETQRTGDLVVFTPTLLEPYPEDEQEQQDFHPPYPYLHTLEKGGFRCWLVDGHYPGPELFGRLKAALEERGLVVDVRCDSEYTIADPDRDESSAGKRVGGSSSGRDGVALASDRTADASRTEAASESGDQRPWTPPPGRLDGIYFLLGAPIDYPLAQLDALLHEYTREWPHPLAWLELAREAGRPVERHEAVIQRYDL